MAYAPLSCQDREAIKVALVADPSVTFRSIALSIGRHESTVSRELKRNGGRKKYCAMAAQLRAQAQRQRPRVLVLVANRALRDVVTADLKAGFSPAGIAARQRHAASATVATETIYQAVYGNHLDVKARDCLRSRRPRRRHRRTRPASEKTHVLGAFSSIHDRPAAVEARIEPGHWEGDLIIGAHNRSALITLVERVTRFTVLADLPCGYDKTEVLAGLTEAFETIPESMRKTLTWDRGSEMASWPILADTFDLAVFFCDPHSPWQRGLNEHTNRLLRYWLPKGTDLRGVGTKRLTEILAVLNHQPRRSLNWQTPAHHYNHHTMH